MIRPINFNSLGALNQIPGDSVKKPSDQVPIDNDPVLPPINGGADDEGAVEFLQDGENTVLGAKKLIMRELPTDWKAQLDDANLNIMDPGNRRQDFGYDSADDARASLTKDGLTDDIIDKYYNIVKEHGRYYADPKDGVTINRSEETYESSQFSINADGTVVEIPKTYKNVYYDIKNADGTSVKITVDGHKNVRVSHFDKDGNKIPDPDLFNTNDLDMSKVAGYEENAQLHERGKGYSGSVDKMKQTMTNLLNNDSLKAQLKAKFDAYVKAAGLSWTKVSPDGSSGESTSYEMFEQFYQNAINSTINDASLVSGRGGRGFSKTGHAYANTQDVINAFLKAFTSQLG